VTRTFLEAVGRPFVLSQRPLLTEKQVLDAASIRGLRLFRSEQLDGLHRREILVPLLRVDRPVRRLRAESRRSEAWRRWGILTGAPPVHAHELLEEVEVGRVVPVRDQPFRRWSTRQRTEGDVSFLAYEYLFSPYQLLTIHRVREALDSMLARRAGAHPADWTDGVVRAAREASIANDRAVVLLSALEPVYYPAITGRTTLSLSEWSFEDYQQYVRDFDPLELHRWLEWDAADLRKQAEAYLWDAHSHDPLKNWRDLVALVHPDKWTKLEGDALLAVDLRIAAEMILLFLEDLAEAGAADPLPTIPRRAFHPLADRLRPDRDELDPILSDYGLSPHPAVLLVVEGPTEQDLLPKVMRLLGVPTRDSFIRIVPLGGVDKQIELLARFISPPLRRLDAEAADMVRPPLRVLVVMDAESGYGTPAKRAARKKEWVMHIWNMLEGEFRTDAARDDIALMVDVTTWNTSAKDIEYAHFTPRHLARAVLRTGRTPTGATVDTLEASIIGLKAGGSSVDKLWGRWPEPRPDTALLWRQLWPVLRRRIQTAQANGKVDRIPVCRIVVEAYERAARPRRHVMMRVG